MISSTASFLSIKNLLSSNELVNHTQEVISGLNKGNALILEAQSGMRGFLIAGNEVFIDDLVEIEKESNNCFDKLELLTVDNSNQQLNLRLLKPLRAKFFKYLERRIELKRINEQVVTYDLSIGKDLMDDISRISKNIENNEKKIIK